MTRPVRALLINENIGGHATVHRHLRAVAATRSDVELHVVDVPAPGWWRKVAAAPVPGLARADADLRPVRYQLAQSAWVARRLPGWLAAGGYDVVHLYTHNVGLLARSALRRLPYVVTIDSTNAQSNLMQVAREPTRFSPFTTHAVRPFERAVYAGAHRVVANSGWCARSVVGDYGIDPARVATLPMGVPVPPLPGARLPGRTRTGLPRVVFVGRTLARKGGLDLLAVHQRWLADRCELVLVTHDRVPPGRNVTVLSGVHPGDGQLDDVLASAAVFVLPSYLDQWPNAVMEAMASGVAVVVSDVGGMPEMVDGAGVVLPDRAPQTLRDALAGLLDDPARRAVLGARARRRVEEDLDVTCTANRLLDLLREAALSPPPRVARARRAG